MQKIMVFLLSFCLLCAFPFAALADDAGVLSEGELTQWIDQLLLDTRNLTPLNAPVDEAALTADGYAFLYDFATIYYNKPVLDATSVLQAVSITSDSYQAVRGLRLGSSEDELIDAFGWQNPYLMGDGSFAAFYRMDELPRAAYWSWAQHDDEWVMTSVQCALHVGVGDSRYTDAGIRFTLENGRVSEIYIYGLSRFISLEEVQTNLDAVADVEAASTAWAMDEHVAGYAVQSGAAPFSEDDLAFSGMDFRTMSINELQQALGENPQTETVSDGSEQMITAQFSNAYLSGTDHGMDVLSVADDRLTGPRGLRVGDSMEAVLLLFESDGQSRTLEHQALLYGDGANVPFGVLERSGSIAAASYAAQMQRDGEWIHVSLRLQFEEDRLTEWMIYTW